MSSSTCSTLSQINRPYNPFDFNPGFRDKYATMQFFKWESKKQKIPSKLHLGSFEHPRKEAGGCLHPPLRLRQKTFIYISSAVKLWVPCVMCHSTHKWRCSPSPRVRGQQMSKAGRGSTRWRWLSAKNCLFQCTGRNNSFQAVILLKNVISFPNTDFRWDV